MLAKPQRKLSKNGVFLEQGFVCYKSILTGESRGILCRAYGESILIRDLSESAQTAVEGHFSNARSLQELHHDERLVVFLVDVIDRADIGMVQSGRGLGLSSEASQRLWVAGYILGEKFESD